MILHEIPFFVKCLEIFLKGDDFITQKYNIKTKKMRI